MSRFKLKINHLPVVILLLVFSVPGFHTVHAENGVPPSGEAPAGEVLRPLHLGRCIGDIESMIHFYHDLLGNGLLAERDQSFDFFSSQPLTDFVSSPKQAEYRAVNMPVPGTSIRPGEVPEMVVEVIEFRNIERHQYMPGLQDSGVSSLKLIVRDLDGMLANLKEAGVLVLTAGGEPVAVPAMPGLSGSARAVIVRDPDGYPVELLEITPAPETSAPSESNIIGAHISLVVDDIEATQSFYRNLIGPELQTWAGDSFRKDENLNKLRNTTGAEIRVGSMLVPGSALIIELLHYRNIDSVPYRPVVQDIGTAHVGFMVKDMDVMMDRLGAAGVSTLGRNGGWYYLNPDTRALYTRDPNGFFVELMERKE